MAPPAPNAPDAPRPDALRRAQIAQLAGAPGYDPFIALITPNSAARGLLTAITWPQARPRWEREAFASTALGLDWLEERRGEPLPVLRALASDVLARARRSGLRASVL